VWAKTLHVGAGDPLSGEESDLTTQVL